MTPFPGGSHEFLDEGERALDARIFMHFYATGIKGWNILSRLYGPLQPWFDKTWRPGDFELV